MASNKDYLTFVLEQLSDLDDISYRAMMGEYILYFRGKIIGGIYDDRLLVKPVQSPGHVGPLESSPRGQSFGAPHGISALPPLQCRTAETPPETDVDALNPRPGAAAGSLSRGQSARSCRTRLIEVRQTSNSTTSAEQSGVHTTAEGPRNGGRDGRRRVQGTLRPHAPPGRASGGRP